MRSYDDWKQTEPDEPNTRVRCASLGCENRVTFPDFELYCTNCLVKFEQRRKELAKQSQLQDVTVRR